MMVFRLFLCLAAVIVTSTSVRGATILSVGGSGSGGGAALINSAAAVSFSLASAQNDVTIAAELECLGCGATVWLTRDLGSNFDPFTDVVDFGTYTGNTLFIDLDLSAGTYFLVVANNSSGLLTWIGSNPFTETTAISVTRNPDFLASTLGPSIPGSTYTPRTFGGLHYALIVPDPAPVPEPGSFLLFGTSLLVFALRGHRLNR